MSIADFFRRSDAGRRPELLPLRYHRMQANAFAFFRGSAPLFYQQYGREKLLKDSPLAWLCGDAHVENFGSYRAGNGLVYFGAEEMGGVAHGAAYLRVFFWRSECPPIPTTNNAKAAKMRRVIAG